MESTHEFKLLSGVECEVKELTGRHQKMLTSSSSGSFDDKLFELLSDVIVRVGDNRNIGKDFIKKMLSCDKKKALIEVRQFSLGFEDSFSFTHEYIDSDGGKQKHDVTVYLEDGEFPSETVKKVEDGKLVDANFDNYDDVLASKDREITLPRSEQLVRFTLLDGKGEAVGAAAKKSERSSHTLLKMRNPVYYHQKDDKGEAVPVQLSLDNLVYLDIEYLRKQIKLHEGDVDTEIVFEHPESDKGEDDVKENVLGIMAFFFPSEAL